MVHRMVVDDVVADHRMTGQWNAGPIGSRLDTVLPERVRYGQPPFVEIKSPDDRQQIGRSSGLFRIT